MSELRTESRIHYLDIIRTIACLCVVMIHTSGAFVAESTDINSVNFLTGLFYDGLTRIGVPLFIMISGALMLDKDYLLDNKKLFKKILRMVVFFVFWSALYCFLCDFVIKTLIEHEPFSVSDFVVSFLEGSYHLWFVYLIIGLYLITPLLRLWVNDKNKKYVEYFIILSLVFTFAIPEIIEIGACYNSIFLRLNDFIEKNLYLNYLGGYTSYYLLGWYIHNYGIKREKAVYALGVFGFVMTVAGSYALSASTGHPETLFSNLYINVFMQAASVFLFIRQRFISNGENRFFSSVSKCSLGIYAIHYFAVLIILRGFKILHFDNALVIVPISFAVSFVLAYLLSFILSKIPVLKKLV